MLGMVKMNKMTIKKMQIVVGLFLMLFLISSHNLKVQAEDLDKINNYVVTVEPYSDGSAEITYHIEWEVLDSSSEGELTWIKVGIPNKYVEEITAISDNIDKISYYKNDGDYVRIDFDRSYYEGEILDIDFSVHQHRLYEELQSSYYYSFTPGWFTDTNVEWMEINWKAEPHTYCKEGEAINGFYNVRNANMGHNEKLKIRVSYAKEYYSFLDDYGVEAEEQTEKIASIILLIAFVGVPVILVIYLLFFRKKKEEKGYYSKHSGMGRYYYHNHTTHTGGGHGGGGCACACACACAGGGRAGCATKEFYMAKRFQIKNTR